MNKTPIGFLYYTLEMNISAVLDVGRQLSMESVFPNGKIRGFYIAPEYSRHIQLLTEHCENVYTTGIHWANDNIPFCQTILADYLCPFGGAVS